MSMPKESHHRVVQLWLKNQEAVKSWFSRARMSHLLWIPVLRCKNINRVSISNRLGFRRRQRRLKWLSIRLLKPNIINIWTNLIQAEYSWRAPSRLDKEHWLGLILITMRQNLRLRSMCSCNLRPSIFSMVQKWSKSWDKRDLPRTVTKQSDLATQSSRD